MGWAGTGELQAVILAKRIQSDSRGRAMPGSPHRLAHALPRRPHRWRQRALATPAHHLYRPRQPEPEALLSADTKAAFEATR